MKSIVRVAISALLVGTTLARPQFASLVPNGNAGSDASSGLSCAALGHEGCVGGATLNAFGTALKAAGKTWTKELCEADSDGDGVTNGEELGDPCCLWTPDNPNPEGFRVDNLSHPGDASEAGAKSAPKCGGKGEKKVGGGKGAGEVKKGGSLTPATTAAPVGKYKPTDPVKTEAPKSVYITTAAPVDSTKYVIPVRTDAPKSGYDTPVVLESPKPNFEPTYGQASSEPSYEPNSKHPSYEGPKKEWSACLKHKEKCSDYAKCCEANDVCIDAPWAGYDVKLCLPKAPKCYDVGKRCAGAEGYEYVPYAPCCDEKYQCIEDGKSGWGRFCVAPSKDHYGAEASYGTTTPPMKYTTEAVKETKTKVSYGTESPKSVPTSKKGYPKTVPPYKTESPKTVPPYETESSKTEPPYKTESPKTVTTYASSENNRNYNDKYDSAPSDIIDPPSNYE